jgi:hypothetical protein
MAIRKKKINYTPWLIGLGAAGVIGYLFRKEIKNLIMPGSNEPEPEPEIQTITNNVVTPGGYIPVQTTVTAGFHKLGTPKDQLNFDQYFNFGDRGQEVAKMQQILNRISEISKKPKVTEDGIYGQGTQARLSQMFGNTGKINLYKMYAALFAIYSTKKDFKSLDKWFIEIKLFWRSK